jgi:hypothetical protein
VGQLAVETVSGVTGCVLLLPEPDDELPFDEPDEPDEPDELDEPDDEWRSSDQESSFDGSSGVVVTPVPLVTPVWSTVGVVVALAADAECPRRTTTRLANPPKLAAAATALLRRSARSRASRSGVMGSASSGSS